MDGEKQDTIIGKSLVSSPVLAGESVPTAEPSTPVPSKAESASIKIALVLGLLQTDYFDLQSKGLKVAILAKDGRLYASVEYPGHELNFEAGEILLDGAKVSDA